MILEKVYIRGRFGQVGSVPIEVLIVPEETKEVSLQKIDDAGAELYLSLM
jgi:hypothetical protein